MEMYYVLVRNKEGNSFTEVDSLKVCSECIHYRYKAGSCCTRKGDPRIHNIITGAVYERFSSIHPGGPSCRTERFSDDEEKCGIEGRFWKSKGQK